MSSATIAGLADINPHMAMGLAESAAALGDAAWLRFCRRVETLLGHDLDGDDRTEGFSLDIAHDYFRSGSSADQYAADVQVRPIYITSQRSCTHEGKMFLTPSGRPSCRYCGYEEGNS